MRRWISLMLAVLMVMLSVFNGTMTAQAAGAKNEIGAKEYTYLNRGLCKEFTINDKNKLASIMKKFPKTVQVTDENGNVSEVKVSWTPTEDPDQTDRFYYVFVPKAQDAENAKDGLDDGQQPYIVVWIESKTRTGADEPDVLGELPGYTNEEKVFLFLKNHMKFNNAICCGILANIKAESGFNPNALGDKGTSYGICQWHNSKSDPRWEKLKNFCNTYGLDWHSLEGQLYYLDYELRVYFPGVLNNITHCSNDAYGAYLAGFIWCYYFEIPANKENVSVYRGNIARDVYWPKYGGYVGDITYTDVPEGKYYLRNLGTNLYADLSGGIDAFGQNVGVYTFGGGPNQVMILQKDAVGYAIRPSVSAGRVLKADGETVYAGNNVCLKDYAGGDQTGCWRFQKVGDGYVIRNVQNQMCVWDNDQSNLFLSTYTEGNYYQMWALEPYVEQLTGTVTINGDLKYGCTLRADLTGTNNTGILSYQWRRDNVDIPGANQYGYMLTGEDVGKTITCLVRSSEQQGDLFGIPAALIGKGDGPEAPTLTTNVIGRIGAKEGEIYGVTSAMEYTDKADQTGWKNCKDDKISALAAGTYYVRYKETDYTEAGKAAKVRVFETENVSDLFSDLDKDKWYMEAVQNVYKLGLMNGVGNWNFAPDQPLTRAQCAVVLYNMAGRPLITYKEETFKDAPKGQWFTDAVEWAYKNEITSGIGGKLFGTQVNISREQFVTMLYHYAEKQKVDVTASVKELKNYDDAGKVKEYAKKPMSWAIANKIITGKSKKILDPEGMATRAECAQILSNYLEFTKK